MTNAPDPNVSNQPTTQVAGTPATSQPQKSPLDILEEILKDKGGAGQADATSVVSATTTIDPAKLEAEQEAVKLAEVKVLEQQRLQEDQAEIATRQAELQQAKDTPAYQARVQQAQVETQQASDQTQAQSGHEIKQLQHIKVEEVGEVQA